MKKEKNFQGTRFGAEVLQDALRAIEELAKRTGKKLTGHILSVNHGDAKWTYDSVEEFYADFRKYNDSAAFHHFGGEIVLAVYYSKRDVSLQVTAPDRSDVEAIFNMFESRASQFSLPPEPSPKPTVFIGHGRSQAWRDLKDHLHEKHGFKVEAYETGARAGHTIRDILEDMVRKSSFAVLVMTAEDLQADGGLRTRQNVIHEAGIFQGRLGFPRAILLIEDGVESFSNVDGVQHIPFSKGKIKETFGEVLATLRREFPP